MTIPPERDLAVTNQREPEPWETCLLTRLIFFFLGADLMMMLVRVIEAFGPRTEARR